MVCEKSQICLSSRKIEKFPSLPGKLTKAQAMFIHLVFTLFSCVITRERTQKRNAETILDYYLPPTPSPSTSSTMEEGLFLPPW